MPDNKKNPQQDQQRKGMDQDQGQGQERQKQGDRGQPGFNEREDRGGRQQQNQQGDQEMDRHRQGATPGQDQEQDQERGQVRDRDINPGKQSFGKQGVTADEDFDRQENEDEDRITQRNPQQGMATPKPERK
jgi:hypothetical protein